MNKLSLGIYANMREAYSLTQQLSTSFLKTHKRKQNVEFYLSHTNADRLDERAEIRVYYEDKHSEDAAWFAAEMNSLV